jgi:hypothetical protein
MSQISKRLYACVISSLLREVYDIGALQSYYAASCGNFLPPYTASYPKRTHTSSTCIFTYILLNVLQRRIIVRKDENIEHLLIILLNV